jgi:hypothetical protein
MIGIQLPSAVDFWTGRYHTFGTTADADTVIHLTGLYGTETTNYYNTLNDHKTDDYTAYISLGTSVTSHTLAAWDYHATQQDEGELHWESASGNILEYSSKYPNHLTYYSTAFGVGGNWSDTGAGDDANSFWHQADTYYEVGGSMSMVSNVTTQTGTTWWESTWTTVESTTDAYTINVYDYMYSLGGSSSSHGSNVYPGKPGHSETTVETTYSFEAISTHTSTTTVAAITGAYTVVAGTTVPTITNTTVTAETYKTERVSTTYTQMGTTNLGGGIIEAAFLYYTINFPEFDLFRDDWVFTGLNDFEGLPDFCQSTDFYDSFDGPVQVSPYYNFYVTVFNIIDNSDYPETIMVTHWTTLTDAMLTSFNTWLTSDTHTEVRSNYYGGQLPQDFYTEEVTIIDNIYISSDTYEYAPNTTILVSTTNPDVGLSHAADFSHENEYIVETRFAASTSYAGIAGVNSMLIGYIPSYFSGHQIQPAIYNTDVVFAGVGATPMPYPQEGLLNVFAGINVRVPFGINVEADYENAISYTDGDTTWNVMFNLDGSPVFSVFSADSLGNNGSFENTFFGIGAIENAVTQRVEIMGLPLPAQNIQLIGGRAHASEGVETVWAYGLYESSDRYGSGLETFSDPVSFTLDTTDLNAFGSIQAYRPSTSYGPGGAFSAVDIILAHFHKHTQ